jgi:hypothetical protein
MYETKKNCIVFKVLLISKLTFVQMNLRTTNELINTKEPAWELVRNWINTAKNVVEVLPLYSIKARETL